MSKILGLLLGLGVIFTAGCDFVTDSDLDPIRASIQTLSDSIEQQTEFTNAVCGSGQVPSPPC